MKLKNYLLIAALFVANNYIVLRQSALSFASLFFTHTIKSERISLLNVFKKSVVLKTGFVLLMLLLSETSYTQTYKTFAIRKKIDIRGSMVVAGNNILGQDNLPFNDNTKSNQDISMKYIDIDSDASTFSSSSADLSVPTQINGTLSTCYRVSYAALYWGAMLQSGSRTDINKVKLKLPGASTYSDINGTLIYDANSSPIIPDANKPYACYADVTSLLSGLSSAGGTYTVANVIASEGSNGSTGLSAGWTLFVVYEDPSLHMKSFNVFDGFSHIYDSHFEKIPVTGFITPPSGPVDLQFAYAALDGDKPKGGTKLEFGTKEVTTPLRSANKFFSSTIENTNGVQTPRNPSGSNTLGYDTGVLEVVGANPEYIKNNQTSTDFTLQVARGQADPVFLFFSAYAVDIIAPKIDLTKLVKNTSGVDIGGTNVTLGQSLTYEISYQNVGNDNVNNFTIKDVLPENIVFNPLTNIDYTNSGGATLQSYDPATRTIIFTIPNSSVLVNGALYTIRLNIQVVPNCNMLSDACSNVIMNQAFATYSGIINTNTFEEEGSFASTACKLGSPESTNFLVDISNCTFERTEVLCGASVVLSASDGYASYSWSTSPTGTPVIGTAQTYTATQTGVYYVKNTPSGTCLPINEKITVVPYGNTITNPVIPFADLLPICPNNGKVLPNIFLCGANATRAITTGISDAASIVWQKLNEASCPAVTVDNCANESSACTWNQVGTGPDYTANTAGQYRVTINYVGGCYSVFYFNVYQNLLSPTVTTRDIICSTLGEITVGGVPAGYEYSLNAAGPYQTSNVFSIATPNSYTVYIKQVGVVTNPCIFTVPDILIRNRVFTVSKFVTQPLCNGDKGAIKLAANDARPQYYFSIHQGGTLVNSVGPIMASEYEFSGLNPGIYTVRVRTEDGCDYSENIEIIEPPLLTATSALTKPLTCTDGQITVYPVGGTPPYTYYVNSTTDFQNTSQITVTNPLPPGGVYTIDVFDSKNCKTTTTITVAAIPPPVYTVSQTNILCYNDTTGEIKFNVTNANGYTLAYSIDNGVTYVANPTFSNLSAGTYTAILKYSLLGADCFSTAEVITITQPTTALTASAGVSELAGCGPLGEGKIRITNPQGGTPFPAPNYYLYSFDNQATWVTSNEAYLAPGTYTVYIKDANGCIYAMPNIIIDPKPVEPTIEVEDAVFNCDGTATSTVTVTNNGGANYSYQYLLDGTLNANIPSNVFTNVPSGTHTVSVSYTLLSVPTYSNLLKEDFGSGAPTTTSGIASAYCFNDQHVLAPYACGTRSVEDNQYSVASFFWRSDDPTSNNTGAWYHFKDHTSNGTNVNGRYLLVNIGSAAGPYGVLYSKPIVDIIPNQDVKVDLYLANLIRTSRTGAKPDFIIELVDGSGAVVASQATGEIANNEIWNLKSLSLNPGNNTNLTFKIRSGSILYSGNDALIDDITVYQLPKSCITTKDFTVIIPTDEAFTASITGFKNVTCAGANNGEITIAAQNFDTTKGFQYSINNGVTWFTQMTSPYTITGLADATYNLQIRYDATSTGTCVKPFTQIITAPTALITTATVTKVATCISGATITASSTGGTLAYRYELWDATGTNNVQPSQNTGIFTNVAPGTYIVRGYDANNCTDDADALVVLAPPTLTASLDASSDLCFDSLNQASLVVNALGGTAPYTFSLDGAPAQNSNTFNTVSSGNHSVLVTDSFGCTAPAITVSIAPQLTTVATTTKTLDCTGNPNAVISGTISGGNAPFVITVLSGTGPGTIAQPTATTFTYTTAVASTYQFQIQDAQGCITTATATVNSLTPITATTTNSNPSCNGAFDGSVQIVPSGGVGPYTYSSDGITYVSSSLFSGLGNGTHTFYIKDSKECFITKTVTLTQPTALVTSASATAFSCSVTNTKQSATITIAVPTTGTAPYQYSFNGGGYTNVNTLTINDNGTDQVISYSVKDAKGCVYSNTITVLKLNPPTDLSFAAAPITCTAPTTTVTVTATNGVGILTYAITSPAASVASNTTGVFAGLLPGTYIFKVTDANGCYFSESYVVNSVTPITVIGSKLSDVLCNAGNTGSVRYTVSGFSGTYSYSINGGSTITGQTATTINLTNQFAGTYAILITDEVTGCTANASVTILEPTILTIPSTSATNVHCNNDNSQITVMVSGGTANYLYAAVIAGSTAPIASVYNSSNIITVDTNSATNLSWDVYVKDAKGCIVITTVDVITDDLPIVTASVNNQCTSSGSNFTITASGTGLAPLTYSINGTTFQTGSTFTVTPGSYTVTVKDKNGCTAQAAAPTVVYPAMIVTAVLTKDNTCFPAPTDASMTISVTGGEAPFGYRVKVGAGSYIGSPIPFGGTSFTFNTSTANTYQFEITDANGCTKESNVISTTAIVPVTASFVKVDPTCNGFSDGSIRLTALTGEAPFTYSIDGGATFVATNVFGGLASESYPYVVRDKKGCDATGTIILDNPAPIDVSIAITDILCNANTPGSLLATINSGGIAPFTYTLYSNTFTQLATSGTTAATSYNFAGLTFGDYYITIVDAKGCEYESLKQRIKTPPFLSLAAPVIVGSDCVNGATVQLEVISGGVAPYKFSIFGQPTTTSPAINTPPYQWTFTNLLQGTTYYFQVEDANLCTSILEVIIPPISTIAVNIDSIKNVTCKGSNNGILDFTVSSFDTSVTTINYEILDALTNAPVSPVISGAITGTAGGPISGTITSLPPGDYLLKVTESTGTLCSAIIPFSITQPLQVLASSITAQVNANCDLGSQITLTTTGGTGPYEYAAGAPGFTPIAGDFGTSNVLTLNYVAPGNWDIVVRDANDCRVTIPVTISKDDDPTINTPAAICYDGNPFTITISGTVDLDLAGTEMYSVNGSAFQVSPSFTFNASGTYNLVIKDGNGCTATVPYEVKDQLELSATLTKELDCTATPNAQITLTTTGGYTTPSANYTYEVSTNGGGTWTAMATNVYQAVIAGTYDFRVTDANNSIICQTTTTFILDPIPTTVFNTTVTNVSCNGGNDGSITVNVTSGVGPFEYQLGAGIFQSSNSFTGLTAGTAYVITVRNAKNCTLASLPITIKEPDDLTATSSITTALVCGAGNAAQPATVTVSGIDGTAPYTYSFDGGANYTATPTYQSYTGITFDVYVKDANGCIFILDNGVDIPALDAPRDLNFAAPAVTCSVLTTTVTVTVPVGQGGIAPFTYNNLTSGTASGTGVFAGLLPGTYLFQVTDANFCTYQESHTVNPVTNITVSGQLISDVTCNPGANGEVLFTVGNFAGMYSYSLDGGTTVITGQTNPTITVSGLSAASTQTIIVTDETTGCTATTFIDVSQPAPLALTANPFINANCNFGAQVSVTASGGVAPYSYSYVISGDPAGTYSASASAVLNPATATSWDVYVKDANNCVITTPLTIAIATDPLPTGITVSGLSQCPSATGDYTFTVNVATGVGPYEYSIGSGFQTNPTFTVNASGTYDVIVKDANGCSTTATGLVVILPALQLQATITALPTCIDGDGTLMLLATGGSGNYEYSIDSGTYQASANFTNIFAGTHTVTVRDITTNCTKSISVILAAATPITSFALSKVDVTCNGGNDGSITATMTTPAVGVNDNPIYRYSIDGGATTQTSTVFSGLIAGTYTIDVTSGRGCEATQTITVDEPAIITVPAPTVSQYGCNTGSNATNYVTITVTGVTGGSGTYANYEFIKGGTVVQFGANNTYTESDLLGGSYTVNVYDNKGCIGTAPSVITIAPFIALDKANVAVNNAITCTNLEDITVSVSSIGGTSTNLQYTVADSNATTGVIGANYNFTNATGIFTGLNIGNYLITVENLDTGCSIQSVHYVNNPNTFDLTIDTIVDVTCFNGNNGSVNVTFVDRVISATNPNQSGPFNYTIVDALGNSVTAGTAATAGPITINTLAAGTYTITATLTNSPFCTVSKNFTITQPTAVLAIAETHTAITCVTGNNDGSISASAVGGWPGGYQFELTGPMTVAYSSQSNFTNLTAGTYTVNVRDSKGCVATTTVTLVVPTPITVTASSDITMLNCKGDKNATITVDLPTGGQGSNYLYTLNTTSVTPPTASGPQISPVFSGLGAGTYTITVTDGYSCSATSAAIIITEPTEVKSNLVVATTQTCLTQTTLTLSATGGTGLYTYSDSAAFTTILGSFVSSVTFPVPVGTYVYYVRDANGCVATVSNQIKIDPLPALIINLDKTNAVINCAGDNTGVIVATAQGGLGNYIYTLQDASGNNLTAVQASPGVFTELFAGNYQVKVDSGDCTTTSSIITITQPLAPLAAPFTVSDVTCNGANNGSIEINASGGTGIIKYAISPNLNQFVDDTIFDKLAPGTYDVIVQDVLGCYIKINFTINEPDLISVVTDPSSIIPEVCEGDKDGEFSITISGGTAPYSVSLDNPSGTYTTGTATQTDFDFTGLTGGAHTVYIRDNLGCNTEWTEVLPESIRINPIAVIDYSCVNNAASNTVTVTVDASITNLTDVDYSLDGASYQTSNVFTNVAPGTGHYVDVRHTNGCVKRTASFDIVQVDPLALVLNDGGLNEIVATATGGGGGYQYTLNGESYGTKNTFIIYKSGDYTVEVTDSNGCVVSATRYFEYIDVCIPNYFTPNGDGVMDGWAPGCTINYKDLTFDIFDRYGRKIATYRLGQYWDGKYNGNELPSGDYWYVLKLNDLKDAREFVGHFTLYR
ncbi:T9SS type B sorting domain-containing protein [Flavobacterium sp. 120]|uniref:T9SS type B sorting domain-containing protein n=1 Tax=Flavobacterium sp. 120 TaxID=2135626 RepID=UPI000EAD419A|nr:T9SS type B sorting domain-containing protein [Flavobacterium sp. 120]RKS15803.1 gliding motility-associated-like protein [Flavobacterium sp. 120]